MSTTLTNVFFFSFTIFYAMGTSVPYNLFQEKQHAYADNYKQISQWV